MSSTVFYNAKIYTVDPRQPFAEAVEVENGRIKRVGTSKNLLKDISPKTEKIDLSGKLLLPAFEDSHMHLLQNAQITNYLDVSDAKDRAEIVDRLAEFAGDNTREMYVAFGWNEETFPDKKLITKQELDKAVPERPALALRRCMNIAVVNSAAIDKYHDHLAEAASKSPDSVELNPDGSYTGLLRGNAVISEFLPVMDSSLIRESIAKVASPLHREGITVVNTDDFTVADKKDVLRAYFDLIREGKLPIRIVEQARASEEDDFHEYVEILKYNSDISEDWFKGKTLKLVSDGTLGGRTAFLKEPYEGENESGNRGQFLYSDEELKKIFDRAAANGFQLAVHAIGDGAISRILREYDRVNKKFNLADPRNIIIHDQLLLPEHFEQFVRTGTIASVQPLFISSDYPIVETFIGKKRAESAYAWHSLLERGVNVASGSDSPIESFSPLKGIYALVTRKDEEERPETGWHTDERFTVEEAVYTYTLGAARQSFSENIRGSITPGKEADFAVLSDDIFSIEPEAIKDVSVVRTILNGRTVYEA